MLVESAVLLTICIIDMVATIVLNKMGIVAGEANIFLKYFWELGLPYFIIVKLFFSVGPIVYINRLAKRSTMVPKLLRVGIVVYLLIFILGSVKQFI